jgi:hypothetical protein
MTFFLFIAGAIARNEKLHLAQWFGFLSGIEHNSNPFQEVRGFNVSKLRKHFFSDRMSNAVMIL